MDDFHNQLNSDSTQKPYNPVASTYGNPMPNQREKQTNFQPGSNHTSKQHSHPLLFIPPLVVDTMISKEKKGHKPTLEHEKQSFHLNELQSGEENTHPIKEEPTSSDGETTLFERLEDQFIDMLEESSDHFEESSSLYEESSDHFEESSLYEESSDHFEESSSLYEESSDHFEESSLYEESSDYFVKSSSLYEESSDHSEESSSLYEESSDHSEESSSLYEESSDHSEESSSLYEESSDHSEESSSLYEESSDHSEESSSLYEESSDHSEESSSLYEESSSEHADASPTCQNKKDSNLKYPSIKRILPIVKLPVVLANLNFHIDLFDSFLLQIPIDHITKVDWHIHSFDCQVLLPSPNVVLKGTLIADITYVDDVSSLLHTVKVNIPLNKWMKANWFYPPELSSSYQAEYMYQGNENMNVQYHREFSQKFAQPIQSELRNVYIIWHDELISNGTLRELDIQGKVNLSMNLLQSQYVDLNDL